MQNDNTELWLPVRGWEGKYEVSNMGQVRSLDRVVETTRGYQMRVQGRLLKQWYTKDGYKQIALEEKNHSVHSLVMRAFVGERPSGYHICHNDGEKTNNRLSNLRYGTPSENEMDKLRHGRNYGKNKQQCPRGHELKQPNLVAADVRKGWRGCLACARTYKWFYARKMEWRDEVELFQELSDAKYRAILSKC